MKPAHFALAGLIALAGLANIGKAVHIDDTVHLELARGILQHPLRPMSTPLNWDNYSEPQYLHQNQPPGVAYAFAAVMALFGESELALHLLMAAVSALGILLFYRTARDVVPRHALLATALLSTGPAFLPGQNLMTDVPLLVTWLWCGHALLRAREGDAASIRRRYCSAAGAIAVGCLIKYTTLVLLPFFVLTLLFRRRWRMLAFLALPLGVLALWSAWNYWEYGGIHLLTRPKDFRNVLLLDKGVEWIAGVGVAAPFGVILWAQRIWGRWSLYAALVPAAAALAIATRCGAADVQAAVLWPCCIGMGFISLVFAAGGVAATWRQAADPAARDTIVVLAFWLLCAAGGVIALVPFMAMRHVLLAMPPLILLCVRFGAAQFDRRAAIALAVTFALGALLAASDYVWADVYRTYASQIAQTAPLEGRMWTVGHWGWQWYSEREGLEPYDQRTTKLAPGDLLVRPGLISQQKPLPGDQRRLRPERQIVVPAPPVTWVRTMAANPYGGYYAFSWARKSLPFRWTKAPLEVFTIYRVRQ